MTEMVDAIMEQAQVFASSYSLVGGRFDDGSKMQQSEEEKTELRRMIEAALDPARQTREDFIPPPPSPGLIPMIDTASRTPGPTAASSNAWHTACVNILWTRSETYKLFYEVKELAEAIERGELHPAHLTTNMEEQQR